MPERKQDFDKTVKSPQAAHVARDQGSEKDITPSKASLSVRFFCEQIAKDAREEIEKILGRAELSARRRAEEAEKEAVDAARQIEGAAHDQAKSIETRTLAGVSLEMKKTILRLQWEIIEEVLARTKAKLTELRGTKEYASFLKELAAQGVRALGENECVLVPGVEDRDLFTPELVREIEELLGRTSGRKVKLSVSSDLAPEGAGVRVYSGTKTMLFDNTLDARMERLADELKAVVAREVFS